MKEEGDQLPIVGCRVVIAKDSKTFLVGCVKFCGTTSFAPGMWSGVALDHEDVKNDGTVQGISYFKCNTNHGLFVRPKHCRCLLLSLVAKCKIISMSFGEWKSLSQGSSLRRTLLRNLREAIEEKDLDALEKLLPLGKRQNLPAKDLRAASHLIRYIEYEQDLYRPESKFTSNEPGKLNAEPATFKQKEALGNTAKSKHQEEIERLTAELVKKHVEIECLKAELVASTQSETVLGDMKAPLERPGFLPTHDQVSETMKTIQKTQPLRWTLRISDWFEIMRHCREGHEYGAVKEKKRSVNMHDVTALFTKPWTKGTGCGLSVLISREENHKAQLMLSHAWDEDVEELVYCVEDHTKKNMVGGSIALWFCCFANYQAEDDEGPSIQEQLEKDPFRCVIESETLKSKSRGNGMLAIHTTMADIYSRLWCVYEVSCAIKEGVEVEFSVSNKYEAQTLRNMIVMGNIGADRGSFDQSAGIRVNTAAATCSREQDYEGIMNHILRDEGGFEKLDDQIATFRKKVFTHIFGVGLLKDNGFLLRYAWKDAIVGFAKAKVDSAAILAKRLKQIPCECWSSDLLADLNTCARAQEELLEAMQAAKKNGLFEEFFRSASSELWADKKVRLAAITEHSDAFQDLSTIFSHGSSELLAVLDVLLADIAKNSSAFEFASVELLADKVFVLAAIHSIESSHLRKLLELASSGAAIAKNCVCWTKASVELFDDKEFMLAAMRSIESRALPRLLERASSGLRADVDVVLAAIARYGDKEFVLAAIRSIESGDFRRLLDSSGLRADKDVLLAAIAKNSFYLTLASAELLADKEFMLAAIHSIESSQLRTLLTLPDLRAAMAKNCFDWTKASVELFDDKKFILAAEYSVYSSDRPRLFGRARAGGAR